MRALHWWSLAVLLLAFAAFARYGLERQDSAAVRAEIALLEHENRQIAELRAEHERLLAAKVPDAEVERLRNDRAALVRLRAEIRKLEESAERKSLALQTPSAGQIPTRILSLETAYDGSLSLNGAPADDTSVRHILEEYAKRAELVEIRIRAHPKTTKIDLLKAILEEIKRVANELGVRTTVRIETSSK
jgi:hypothetical protein